MYESMKRIFFLSELKISVLRSRYALQAWTNLLRSFRSPLNGLGVLIQISLGVVLDMLSFSSVLYSEVSSCVVVSDSGSGSALDVVAGRSGEESGDEGGWNVLDLCWGAILSSLGVDSVVCLLGNTSKFQPL